MDDARPVRDDEPVMIAWKAYQATPEFVNTMKWARTLRLEGRELSNPYLDGSVWAVFVAGFLAALGKETLDG